MSNENPSPTGRIPAVVALIAGWSIMPIFGASMAVSGQLDKDAAEMAVMAASVLSLLLSVVSLGSGAVALWQARKPLNVLSILLTLVGVAPVFLSWAAFAGLMMLSAKYF